MLCTFFASPTSAARRRERTTSSVAGHWPPTTTRPAGREAFRAAIDLDDGTWARARGWALWKVLITIDPDNVGPDARPDAGQRRVLDAVLSEHSVLPIRVIRPRRTPPGDGRPGAGHGRQ